MRLQRSATASSIAEPGAARRLEVVPDLEAAPSAERPPADEHPLRAALQRLVAAYAAIAIVLLATGFLLTHLLASSVGRWDEHVNVWFAGRRRPPWDGITEAATWSLNTGPVVVMAVLVVGALWLGKRRREALFLASALLLEITVFLSVTFVVARPRPHVHRLNLTPSTSSFPSGHTAAATVFFVGVALLVWRFTERRAVRGAAIVVATAVVLTVAFARVYRGLHHPTDVACGVLLGIACLFAAAWVVGLGELPRPDSSALRTPASRSP